jgi:peptidyl-dipeptidase A
MHGAVSRTLLMAALMAACVPGPEPQQPAPPAAGAAARTPMAPVLVPQPPATAAEAQTFVASAEARLLRLSVDAERASWVQSTYITEDTELLAAQAEEKPIAATVALANEAKRFNALELPYDAARKLRILKSMLTAPAPADAARTEELARLLAGMESQYGRGEYCPPGGECLDIDELSALMAESRSAELDASAIADYFAPLKQWLDQQNRERKCGW